MSADLKLSKFEIEEFHRDVPDENLLADLTKVMHESGGISVSFRDYQERGKYSASTLALRFGTWNDALAKAGISVGKRRNYPEVELFDNMLSIWMRLGYQPRTRDLSGPLSTISVGPYLTRFGSWKSFIIQFVAWANTKEDLDPVAQSPLVPVRSGPRSPSSRLRFKVLQRDKFSCVACGVSPATTIGTILHIDHIVPWSAGGQTAEENMQTLCEKCNLGKSDVL